MAMEIDAATLRLLAAANATAAAPDLADGDTIEAKVLRLLSDGGARLSINGRTLDVAKAPGAQAGDVLQLKVARTDEAIRLVLVDPKAARGAVSQPTPAPAATPTPARATIATQTALALTLAQEAGGATASPRPVEASAVAARFAATAAASPTGGLSTGFEHAARMAASPAVAAYVATSPNPATKPRAEPQGGRPAVRSAGEMIRPVGQATETVTTHLAIHPDLPTAETVPGGLAGGAIARGQITPGVATGAGAEAGPAVDAAARALGEGVASDGDASAGARAAPARVVAVDAGEASVGDLDATGRLPAAGQGRPAGSPMTDGRAATGSRAPADGDAPSMTLPLWRGTTADGSGSTVAPGATVSTMDGRDKARGRSTPATAMPGVATVAVAAEGETAASMPGGGGRAAVAAPAAPAVGAAGSAARGAEPSVAVDGTIRVTGQSAGWRGGEAAAARADAPRPATAGIVSEGPEPAAMPTRPLSVAPAADGADVQPDDGIAPRAGVGADRASGAPVAGQPVVSVGMTAARTGQEQGQPAPVPVPPMATRLGEPLAQAVTGGGASVPVAVGSTSAGLAAGPAPRPVSPQIPAAVVDGAVGGPIALAAGKADAGAALPPPIAAHVAVSDGLDPRLAAPAGDGTTPPRPGPLMAGLPADRADRPVPMAGVAPAMTPVAPAVAQAAGAGQPIAAAKPNQGEPAAAAPTGQPSRTVAAPAAGFSEADGLAAQPTSPASADEPEARQRATAAALSDAVHAAVRGQASLGAVFAAADQATAVPRPAMPALVTRALADLVGLRLQADDGIEPGQLQAVLAKSGVFLEAGLAAGDGGAGEGDLKAVLTAAREALTQWLGGEARRPAGGALQHPPPRRGEVGAAQVASAAMLPAAADELGEALLERTEAALDRIRLSQYASLDPSQEPRAPRAEAQHKQWNAEIPVLIGRETHVIPFQISRDRRNKGSGREDKETSWRIRFSLAVEPFGPMLAQVTMVETGGEVGSVGVTMWAERPKAAEMLGASVRDLRKSLDEAGVMVDDITCIAGPPPRGDGPRSPYERRA